MLTEKSKIKFKFFWKRKLKLDYNVKKANLFHKDLTTDVLFCKTCYQWVGIETIYDVKNWLQFI